MMAGNLAGKRILIVEDEYFIASDPRRAFDRADAVVVGPVADLEGGLSLVEDPALDAAVLDVNLEGAESYPIADRLSGRAVPFMFLTGYDGWALPDDYRDVPRIAKPTPIAAVIDAVDRLVAPGTAG